MSDAAGGDSPYGGSSPVEQWKARLRSLFLVLLLLSEILYLSVRFDTDTIGANASWLAWLLRKVPLVVKAAVAAGASLLVFSGSEYRTRLETFFIALKRPHPSWLRYMLLHLAFFAFFLGLTLRAVAPQEDLPDISGAWIAAWMGILALVLLSWLLAFIPWSAWKKALQQSRGIVLAGIVIGTGAVSFGLLAQSLAPRLTAWTFYVVSQLLYLAGESPVYSAKDSVIGIRNFLIYIGPTCSGLEGIGLVSAFLSVYLWTSRRKLRFPQSLWLFPMGWVLIWVSNAFRIAALVWIGAHRSSDLAVNGFHSQAGWITFNVVGLGIVAATQRARLFAIGQEPSKPTSGTQSSVNPASPYLVPFLALLLTGMVLQAATTQPANWYPLRVVVMLVCLLYYWKSFPRPSLSGAPGAIAIGAAAGLLWLVLMPAEMRAGGGAAALAPAGLPGIGSDLWWAVRLLGYLLLVPIIEEMAFRGYLMRRLIQPEFEAVSFKTFSWFALLTSSVVFGLMHADLWLPGILAGLLFGMALYRRGNLADAVIAHISANALIALVAVATGHWSLLS